MKSNIILTGYMGSGKTTIGKELSKRLDMKFIDTDELIVKKAGMSINKIFEKHGEQKFRDIETEVAKDMKNINNSIISTGGGIILKEENVKALKKAGEIFLLWASSETLYDRLKDKEDRPLLKVPDPEKKIKEMLEKRKDKYQKSMDYKINVDKKNILEVTEEIEIIYLKS
ncbi:MAG: shikimate kinase [Fusobacteriota bacterium]